MYRLTFNGFPIYDPRDDALQIVSAKTHLAVNEPGSLDFTIEPDHPHVAELRKMKGVLELTEDGVVIYRGRIISDTKNFYNVREVISEGLLACLNDSVIPPYNFPDDFLENPDYREAADSGNVVAFFLGWLLSQHNAQVSEEQQIKLGIVTVTDPNNYITRSCTDYSSTWSVILEKLPKSSLGGYLLPRYEANGVYLDYLADFPLTNVQTIEFAENLLDLTSEVNAADIYTQILPVGADGLTLTGPDGDVTSDIVKAGPVLYSRSGVATYGKITRVVKWDDVTEAGNLKTKAAATLAAVGMVQSIKVKACDLHSIDGDTVSFRLGRYTRLISPPHGFAELYPLTALEPDILNPGNTQITLGQTTVTQTDINKATAASAAERADRQQQEINKTKQNIEELSTSTTERFTSMLQTCQSLIMQAAEEFVKTGDLDSYKQTISTQFEQTAQQIAIKFSEVTAEINNVNGDLQQKYNERMKYIRFVDGNIILGEEGNEITLTIEHDRMVFKQKGQEVAYFQHNKFYITDAEFTVSARIGNFAFVPGEEGNLSFRKVG